MWRIFDMPKLKIGEKYSPKPPKIDWLWAAVLERKMVMRYDLKDMADIAGVNYDTMRRLITKSPWDWPNHIRKRVAEKLGIKIIQSVDGVPLEDDEL